MKSRMALLLIVVAVGAVSVTGCTSVPTKMMAYSVGTRFQEDGKFVGAIAKYEVFIKANPKSSLIPNALFRIGECREALKQKAKALEAYQKVIDQYPASDPAQWAAPKVKKLKIK